MSHNLIGNQSNGSEDARRMKAWRKVFATASAMPNEHSREQANVNYAR